LGRRGGATCGPQTSRGPFEAHHRRRRLPPLPAAGRSGASGLYSKLDAYALQDARGPDTYEANPRARHIARTNAATIAAAADGCTRLGRVAGRTPEQQPRQGPGSFGSLRLDRRRAGADRRVRVSRETTATWENERRAPRQATRSTFTRTFNGRNALRKLSRKALIGQTGAPSELGQHPPSSNPQPESLLITLGFVGDESWSAPRDSQGRSPWRAGGSPRTMSTVFLLP